MTWLRDAELPTSFGEVKRYITGSEGIPIETAPLVENVLEDDELVKAIYASPELQEWFAEKGIEKLDFGGGEFGITANMLVDIPQNVLKSVKQVDGVHNLGVAKAKKIIAMMRAAMDLEPYY